MEIWDVLYQAVTFAAAVFVLIIVIGGITLELMGRAQEKRQNEIIEEAARMVDGLNE